MRELTICTGNSRQAATWPASKVTFPDLYERLKVPMRTPETVAEYKAMSKADRDAAKDKGGFMAGTLKGTRRKKDEVLSRSMIALDGDRIKLGFIDDLELAIPYEVIVYTTHSHTPEAPRARLIIPLTRDVSPDECVAIARYLCADMGMEMFDPCSFEVNQLMYWPTCPKDGEYICELCEGEWLDPDKFLAERPDWKDPTKLPRAASETKDFERQKKKQEDPLTKGGVVGAFCRAHDIHSAIHDFLSDVYAESVVEGRYDYIPGEGSAGVVIYDDKFSYSHHATDPACGKLLNAFDLVRIHKFGDDKDSFTQMSEFAMNDEATKLQALSDKQASAAADFDDEEWKTKLTYKPRTTQIENTVNNLMLILVNDEDYKNFAYNEMASRVQVTGPVPWDRPRDNPFWRDADTAQLKAQLDTKYQCFSSRNHDVCFTKVADDRRFHPIRDMLNALPEWDKTERLDTLYIVYFGAADNIYIREASRKSLVAAIARVFKPGIKFDCVPIIVGDQGIGKSTFFDKLAGEYFSDSLSLIDMKDKSGAEKLQGFWILELGELAGMKKADVECVKSFITRRDDDYRPSYGKVVESHPRQCIIVGSTNSESGFLRDITGNRRFWPIAANTDKIKKHSWDMSEEDVQQIWAEALFYFKKGESLKLSKEAEEIAFDEQMAAMETDERQGMVEEYLSTLLPADWETMDLSSRREFLSTKDCPTTAKGTVARTQVSNAEIWCECFGNPLSTLKPADSYSIAALMLKVPGWERTKTIRKLPIYGRQRLYMLED